MKYLLPIVAFLIIWNFSCKPTDNFDTSSDVMLEFSLDTLRFDTVFTELGSATRILKVYNRNKNDIKISKIRIKNNPNNFFRINVDGIAGNEATEIEIAGNDSLYIFGEVTIDPDNPLSISPFVIEDYLVFETNGNTQEVLMEAWGQNANYIPSRFSKGEENVLSCEGATFEFSDPKPYVIYGVLFFDSCVVNMPAGTRIHVHGGLAPRFDMDNMKFLINDGRLIFFNSTLNVNGELNDPVIITGDRLEEPFADIAGQWWGIYVAGTNPAGKNKINYLEIKNSIIGMAVDNAEVELKNSKIYNTSNAGLIGLRGRIDAENSLFYNNGSNAVRIIYGGDYNFKHCTLASYGVDAAALSMNNWLCLEQNELGQCISCDEYRLNANFKNSIIFGSRSDEISLENGDECDPGSTADLNYFFEDCIVRVDELTDQEGFENFFDFCNPCQNADNNDALFLDPNEDDYHLDTLSIAEGEAEFIDSIQRDLDGFLRASGGMNEFPDVGCYEYQE